LHGRAVQAAELRDRARDRHRAHLEPADILDTLVRDRIEGELRQQGRAFGIEHRRLEIEVEVAHAARRELDLAVAERADMDDVAQPRAGGRDVTRRGAAGGQTGCHGHERLASTKRARAERSPAEKLRISAQCASSQLSAARASTCSGTEIETAGSGASSMTLRTTGMVLATSPSGTSKTSSSCTCSSMRAASLCLAKASSMRTMARRMMSAAVPCSRALMAARSLKARIEAFEALMSG